MKKNKKYYLVILTLLCSTHVLAFDNNKQGLVLGVGVAAHETAFKTVFSGSEFSGENVRGLATSLRLGMGVNSRLLLYYFNESSWYLTQRRRGSQSKLTISALNGLGMSYFLPYTPSVYILGGLGLASNSSPFNSKFAALYGYGIIFGAGYEITQHFNIEMSLANMTTYPGEKRYSDAQFVANSAKIMFNYMLY